MTNTDNSLLSRATNEPWNTSVLKAGILGILGILFAFGFSFFLYSFFHTDVLNYLSLSVVCAGLFMAAFLLGTLFIQSKAFLAGIVLLETFALVAPFLNQFSIVFIAGTLATFLLLIWASVSGQREAQERVTIRFFTIASIVFGRLVTALAIMLTAIYISSSQFNQSLISEESFTKILLGINPVIERLVPDVSLTQTLGETAEAIAIRKLNESPEFRSLPLTEEARQSFINEAVRSFEAQVSRSLKIRATQEETIIEVLYAALTENASRPANLIFFQVAGLFIFFFLKGFGILLSLILQPLTFLMYQSMLALGFGRIAVEVKNKEVIVV